VDLQLYMRVLWRFRLLVGAGLLLATGLALLSFASVGPGGFSYREQELWASRATILVTELDFPEGRAVFEEKVVPLDPESEDSVTPEFAAPSRFIELATLYAPLAMGDEVRAIMRRDGPVDGAIEAAQLQNDAGAALPMISIAGLSSSPQTAVRIAERASAAFREYIEVNQRQTGIAAEERVLLQVVSQPGQVELLNGRSKTLPIVVFLTVMLAVVGLAFILENLRPRMRPVALDGEMTAAEARGARQSA